MYSAQILVNNIKHRAKSKNILIRDMLLNCGLNVNSLSQISDKKGLSSFSLAKIADCLDCSVDYLLGRTSSDNYSVTQIGTGNVNGNISNSTLTVNSTSELSEYEADIIRVFRSLTPKQKNQVMTYIYDLEEQTL